MVTRKLRILLIEDVPIYVGVLVHVLEASNFELVNADSLEAALKAADRGKYDVVLLDLGLPDSHGLETFTIFNQSHPELPVVILSGTDDEEMAAKSVQLGAQDYLIKGPYLMREDAGKRLLIRSLLYAIERQQVQTALLKERDLLELRVAKRTRELEIINKRLKYLTSQLVTAQEEERRRISLELHDEAGQALTALKLKLALVKKQLTPDYIQIHEQLQDAIALIENTMDQIRHLAHDLRPPALDTVGINQAMEDYCDQFSDHSGIPIRYKGINLPELAGHIQINLYRMLQEALTNAIKHARASIIDVSLVHENNYVILTVEDNGSGFDIQEVLNSKSRKGIGLSGIEERMEALGGKLVIKSEPGIGTLLTARVPWRDYDD